MIQAWINPQDLPDNFWLHARTTPQQGMVKGFFVTEKGIEQLLEYAKSSPAPSLSDFIKMGNITNSNT